MSKFIDADIADVKGRDEIHRLIDSTITELNPYGTTEVIVITCTQVTCEDEDCDNPSPHTRDHIHYYGFNIRECHRLERVQSIVAGVWQWLLNGCAH